MVIAVLRVEEEEEAEADPLDDVTIDLDLCPINLRMYKLTNFGKICARRGGERRMGS